MLLTIGPIRESRNIYRKIIGHQKLITNILRFSEVGYVYDFYYEDKSGKSEEFIFTNFTSDQQCPVRFLRVFRLLSKSCHSRILLAGIQDKLFFRYPIKAFGYDKNRECKNLTGHC